MKTMILAALAALSLGIGITNAQSLSHNAAPQQRTGNQHNWMAAANHALGFQEPISGPTDALRP